MYIGTQLEAPHGWGTFQAGVRYYLAGDRTDVVNCVPTSTVLIVWFARSGRRWQSWRVHLMTLARAEFEDALTSQPAKLCRCARQYNLPPWLEEVDDVNFDELEDRRAASLARTKDGSRGARSYRQQVEMRLSKIALAVDRSNEILHAVDPLNVIYEIIKSDKSCHAHRAQLWYFAFILHGQNAWALKQPTHRTGLWRRDADGRENTKFGRRSLHGSCFGWSAAGMREKIVECYLKYCGLGKTMRLIHRKSLREDFGCDTVADSDGNFTWVHPQNRPFPSYGQFRYVVIDELTLEFVQRQIYGQARLKSKARVNAGVHTSQYGSILEELQVDAFHVAERPRSLHSDQSLESLVVAEAVCVTTGAVVGVGFSLGGETGEAYRSMLFCMAAPKSYIATLYGIPPAMLDWPMQGLSGTLTSDRGPAGHRAIVERLQEQFPIKTIAPSYSGQAKAPVETTHPKSTQLEGEPSYLVSNLDVIQMMKREILRAAAKNRSKDISARLTDQAIHDFMSEGRVATPYHYWQYLDTRLRTCARQMSLAEAVRSFWTPVKLPVDRDGVRFRHRHYNSRELLATSMMKQVGLVPRLEVSCYIFSLVLRVIWVEVDGRLIELEATRKVRVGDDEMMVPLSELDSAAQALALLQSKTRISAQAAINRAESDFKTLSGVAWDSGTRRKGGPPRPTGSEAHEVKVTKGVTPKRRAA